ncbi:MAG: RNA polymerase sigma factor [Bacteroidota bacterium]
MDDQFILEKLRTPETRNYGFNLLVRAYQKKVYWLVRKMVIDHDDADDITQETFVKIHRNIDGFREDSKLFTWIYRIATNESLSFLRARRRRLFLPIHDVERELSGMIDSGKGIDGSEIEKKLQKAILTLPEKQRLVFNMKYFDDLSYEQIAEITGTSVGALKASHHHAVKKIEEYLEQDQVVLKAE